ncbi:hypothetical protein EBBID32_41620 [Sphingobium indicum BiD32]|uniref:Uncharacterized protein n=1 Tax=Sphingobium indicum BiD32 TaxID=1301087 RepID=N1MW52_9SPHN|nr:hypothetical protein EBBID32_41620 [Sphingobium indicum BiD32]
MACHYDVPMGGHGARQRSPHMDGRKLRGVKGAVKPGKRAFTAFGCPCIINAT